MWLLKDIRTLRAKVSAQSVQPFKCNGFSLGDSLVGVTMLAVVVLGTLSFRVHSIQELQKAEFQMSASRIADLFCQSWKGVRGTESFDPIESLRTAVNFIEDSTAGESDLDWPEDFKQLGTFKVTMDSTPYYASLGYKDIQPGFRALTVMVAWAQRGPAAGQLQKENKREVGLEDTDKIYQLTTYVLTE